jgi:hypothetical protein
MRDDNAPCVIEQNIPLRCWDEDRNSVYFPLLGKHDPETEVAVERVAAGYTIKFTHKNYLIVTTLEIPEHTIVSSTWLRKQICQPYTEKIILPSTTDDPFRVDFFARFGACAANDPDELQKYMISGGSYASCIYFVHTAEIAECLRGHITRDHMMSLVTDGLPRRRETIERFFGEFRPDAWTVLEIHDDVVYYVSQHVLDVLKMTVDDFQGIKIQNRGFLPYSSHVMPFAKLNLEYKARALEKQERVQARTFHLKKELMERTWHPSRFRDWCVDNGEKNTFIN